MVRGISAGILYTSAHATALVPVRVGLWGSCPEPLDEVTSTSLYQHLICSMMRHQNSWLIEFLLSDPLDRPSPDTEGRIRWCAVGKAEQTKCDSWSGVSGGSIECAVAETPDDCIIKILVSASSGTPLSLVPCHCESSLGFHCFHPVWFCF